MRQLSKQEARRIAVRAQLLDRPRPTDALDVVRRLTLLQVDLTAAVAPSADLILWSRLGTGYSPDQLETLISERALVEITHMLRPAEDVALFRAEWERGLGPDARDWELEIDDWVRVNDGCRQDILQRLRSEGPLAARELPDTTIVPWRSTGWTNNRNVMKLLECMEKRGEVAVSSRENRERLWDLSERIYPDDAAVPVAEAMAERARRRLVSLGIARTTGPESWVEPSNLTGVGETVTVEGTRGTWQVDPDQLDRPFRGRAALLSPLDRLIMDRKRMTDVFEFEYFLEMYKPAAKRRWGYYALPILYGDRLVGKLDSEADRAAGVLRVNALHEDVAFSATMRAEVQREAASLARFLELELEYVET